MFVVLMVKVKMVVVDMVGVVIGDGEGGDEVKVVVGVLVKVVVVVLEMLVVVQ